MKRPTGKQILSADYTDIGFERGVEQAKSGEPKSVKIGDIHPTNLAWRWNDAIATYGDGQKSGFDAQLKKNANIFSEKSIATAKEGISMHNLSYQDQLMLIGRLIDQLNQLEGFLGTIREGYDQNIDSSEAQGLGVEYISGLRERSTKLNRTMDHVQNLIQKHRNILEQKHCVHVQKLLQSANEW